jgi:hypothetical protein
MSVGELCHMYLAGTRGVVGERGSGGGSYAYLFSKDSSSSPMSSSLNISSRVAENDLASVLLLLVSRWTCVYSRGLVRKGEDLRLGSSIAPEACFGVRHGAFGEVLM